MELRRQLVEPGRRAIEDVWETEVVFSEDEKLLEDSFVEKLQGSSYNAYPEDPGRRILTGYFIPSQVLDFIQSGSPARNGQRQTELFKASEKYL